MFLSLFNLTNSPQNTVKSQQCVKWYFKINENPLAELRRNIAMLGADRQALKSNKPLSS